MPGSSPPAPGQPSQLLLFCTMPHATGHPYGQPRPDVLVVSPSSLLTGRAAPGAETSLTLCERCSAATETLACYQRYSHPKSETWHTPVKTRSA